MRAKNLNGFQFLKKASNMQTVLQHFRMQDSNSLKKSAENFWTIYAAGSVRLGAYEFRKPVFSLLFLLSLQGLSCFMNDQTHEHLSASESVLRKINYYKSDIFFVKQQSHSRF